MYTISTNVNVYVSITQYVKRKLNSRIVYYQYKCECIRGSITQYVKPIALKFKIKPEIRILHTVNSVLTNFQSKI